MPLAPALRIESLLKVRLCGVCLRVLTMSKPRTMSEKSENRELHLKHASSVIDQLTLIRAQAVPQVIPAVLGNLGRQLSIPCVHLYTVSGRSDETAMFSMAAEWTAKAHPEVRSRLQREALRTLTGPELVHHLFRGTSVFTHLEPGMHACSRLISGLLRDLNLPAYELIPVILHRRLRGMVGLAHNYGADHLDSELRSFVQLMGRVMVSTWLSARREVRRQRRHRQWKRVADGACDFAIEVSHSMMITNVLAFREKQPPALRGLSLEDIVSNASRDNLLLEIRRAIDAGVPGLTEFWSVNTRGELSSFSVRIEPEQDRSRVAANLYLTSNDRERAHAEEVQELRTQLDRSARLGMLGNVATEFAHQLAQPLQAVMNHIFTLRNRINDDDANSEKQRQSLINIEDCLSHASEIIEGVRQFLRNKSVQQEPIELHALLSKAVNLIQVQAETAGIRLQLESAPAQYPGLKVFADSLQTLHVLMNLIINAIEAVSRRIPATPAIRLAWSQSADKRYAIIELSDNGPGVPPENLEKIFERFFTTREEGFGIGLALCRDIIEQQQGTIRIANNKEGGCTVVFTLPVHAEDQDVA